MFPAIKGLRKKEKPGNETAAVCGVSNTHWPSHDVPFPVYPVEQIQLKDPSVFSQLALLSQLVVFPLHSSISAKVEKHKCKDKEINWG